MERLYTPPPQCTAAGAACVAGAAAGMATALAMAAATGGSMGSTAAMLTSSNSRKHMAGGDSGCLGWNSSATPVQQSVSQAVHTCTAAVI
eukprot:350326-Chlamydomonas_euryale.AAC.1